MPKCGVCKEVKTKLDAKNLCMTCRPALSNHANPETLENFIETTHELDSECKITIRELLEIVRKAINVELVPITQKIDDITTQLTQLNADVADHGANITQLRTDCDNHRKINLCILLSACLQVWLGPVRGRVLAG